MLVMRSWIRRQQLRPAFASWAWQLGLWAPSSFKRQEHQLLLAWRTPRAHEARHIALLRLIAVLPLLPLTAASGFMERFLTEPLLDVWLSVNCWCGASYLPG